VPRLRHVGQQRIGEQVVAGKAERRHRVQRGCQQVFSFRRQRQRRRRGRPEQREGRQEPPLAVALVRNRTEHRRQQRDHDA
jgi:hypothetical protein